MGVLTILCGTGRTGSAAPRSYSVNVLTEDAAFSPRDGVSLVSFGGLLHMLGGWAEGVSNNEHWTSSDGVTWAELLDPATELPIETWALPRHTFVGVVYQSKIWAILNDVNNIADDSAHSYSAITGEWEVESASIGFPDNQALYCWTKHTDSTGKEWIYIAGGQNGENLAFATTNDYVHRYDGTTLEKTCDFPVGMGPRSNSVMWSLQGVLFIGSGGTYDSGSTHEYDGTVWRSDDDGVTWTLHAETNAILECQYGNGVVWDGRAWFLAGHNNVGGNRQGLYYSSDLITWTRVSGDTAIAARHASGICVHNNKLYIVSGNLWNDAYMIEVA